jgi:uncharacterized membrane protein
MITVTTLYWLAGLVFASFALLGLRDASNPKRFGNAAFWALLSLSMVAGDQLGAFGNGLLVLALVAIAGTGRMGRGPVIADTARREMAAARHGNRLFALALVIPAVALLGTLAFKQWPGLVDPKQVTLIALGIGVILALLVGMAWLRPAPTEPFDAGRHLADSVGWAAILPQMLASLGAIFTLAGVGGVVGDLLGAAIPDGSILGATIVYALGMALFTMVMGNAFAAFPVMLSAVGMPLLIRSFGGDPAVVCAIGMLAGFCGTLMTPMAANFNIVPAALLELQDRNAVIKAQVGTAIPLLVVNTLLIYWLAFP